MSLHNPPGELTKQVLLPATSVYNVSDTQVADRDSALGWEMIDARTVEAYGEFVVPGEYRGNGSLKIGVILRASATGNAWCQIQAFAGAGYEAYNTHTLNPAAVAINVTAVNRNQLAAQNSFNAAQAGDVISMRFIRYGGHGSDTLAGTLYFVGFHVELDMRG